MIFFIDKEGNVTINNSEKEFVATITLQKAQDQSNLIIDEAGNIYQAVPGESVGNYSIEQTGEKSMEFFEILNENGGRKKKK